MNLFTCHAQLYNKKRTVLYKTIFIMRLIILLTVMFSLKVSAVVYAQKINLNVQNTQLEKVFEEIKRQSGYSFWYKDSLLINKKSVTLKLHNSSLEETLIKCFEGQDLSYEVIGKTISVKYKTPSFLDRVVAAFTAFDVRGTVVDGAGKALAGATVTIKGTNRSVITSAKGAFFISNVDAKAVLLISFLGYKTVEIEVKPILTISLKLEESKLEEVMISTGYQKIKKDQLTGAASMVTERQYQQREAITGNFLESLEGKVPGLVYNSQTGELSIRGVSTFDAVKQPLIVMDGFPTEIDIRTINPNDIVSVSVLRDAAAASIYGVRASNGVIIIETRRGKSGKQTFNLRSSYAIQSKPDFSYLGYAPASEFVQLQKEHFNASKPSYSSFQLGNAILNPAQAILFAGTNLQASNPLLSPEQVDEKLLALGSYDNLEDYGNLFYQQRQVKNVNFDVSGGSDKSTYVMGINYINELPVSKRSENKQVLVNIANTFRFSRRFSFDFKSTYANSKNVSGSIVPYFDFFPYEHLTDENGVALAVALDPKRNGAGRVMTKAKNDANMAAGLYDLFFYPYRELASNTNTVKSSSIRFQGRLNTKITNWMSMDIGGNYENQSLLNDQLQLEDAYDARVLINTMALKDASGKAAFTNMPKGNILRRDNQRISNYTVRGQLNLAQTFANKTHDLSGIVGLEQRKTLNTAYMTSYFGYDEQTLITKPINMSALNTSSIAFNTVGSGSRFVSTDYFNERETDRRFMSYYGQGTYIFKSRYVATGSFRIDQSNLFGVDPKYRNKPLWSAGVNWRIGEEDLIRQICWIDNLQIRAATGFNGNVPTSSNGAFLILSTALNTTLTTPLTYTSVLTPQNQSLRWETTKNYNLGVDFSVLKNRISGSADWYLKRTTDVFGQFDADPTSGYNEYYANTSSIENRGIEFIINTNNIKTGKWEWRSQLTASFNQNKVIDVRTTEFSNSQAIATGTAPVKGSPLGALYSYDYGGLNELGQPFVLNRFGQARVLSRFTAPVIDITKEDMIYNGTTTPKYVLGLNNQFSIGTFDISFLLLYYGGHVMRVEQPNPNNIGVFSNNPLKGSSNYWKMPGDEKNTNIPGFGVAGTTTPGYYEAYAANGYKYADQFVRNADYIRLRDVVITYNSKAAFLMKMGLRNTQLRFQAQNPFRYTFSGNDIDPDAIDRITGVRRLEIQPFYSLTFSTNF